MKLLVCGGRDYSDYDRVVRVLDELKPTIIIQGGAKGADLLAKKYAINKGIHYAEVNALWSHYGRAAGFKRNSAMLELDPDMVVAFPGGKGTDMMVDIARKEGYACILIHEG